MKNAIKLFCLLIAMGAPALSQAQLVKGDRIVSGTFNIHTQSSTLTDGSSSVDGPKDTNVNIEVGGMQMVDEGNSLGLGVRLSMTNSIKKQSDGGATMTNSSPTFEIAPFARSYFTNNARLGIFAEGMIGLSFGKLKNVEESSSGTFTSEVNTSGFNVSARPGFTYYLSDKLGLEFLVGSLGYESVTTKHSSNSKETESGFGISFDLSTVQVGVSLKI